MIITLILTVIVAGIILKTAPGMNTTPKPIQAIITLMISFCMGLIVALSGIMFNRTEGSIPFNRTEARIVAIEGERLPLVYRIQDDKPKYFFFTEDEDGNITPQVAPCDRVVLMPDGENKVTWLKYDAEQFWSWWTITGIRTSGQCPSRYIEIHISEDAIKVLYSKVYGDQL